MDELLQITDALGNNTAFAYDGNGNTTMITDANGHANSYQYDDMDRVTMRTDPLSRVETYSYDFEGNLASVTDRKQQVRNYGYDPLNRLTSAAFGVVNGVAQSSITYSYDAGNRLWQAVDSTSGTITRGFDGLDRLTSEATPEGSIGYTYDNASRRMTMQVSGQQLVSYGWDAANRLTGITQGSASVGFGYDPDNHRQTLTLPDGILATYSYDGDSRLTGISYALGQSSVGTLTYGYDAVGRRTSVGGTMAQSYTVAANPVNSASYDPANELTNWGGIQIGYDANGNVQNDGSHQYTWDARNHLTALDSGTTATFLYDAFGRRAGKTIYGNSTGLLYDGLNPVQELSGTNPTANLLTGGLDEYFLRTDSNGTVNYLRDALGTTLALANSAGSVQTQYAYDPFGNTSISGVLSTSSFQYAGREDDTTGLYYYRARYYDPSIGRFISEDPIGFAGSGSNFYAYAGEDPVDQSDPSGLCSDPGGSGIRFCIDTFIPEQEVWGFTGDNRGADSDGGSWRTQQFITPNPDGGWNSQYFPGTSSLSIAPFIHNQGAGDGCGVSSLTGRKSGTTAFRARCWASTD